MMNRGKKQIPACHDENEKFGCGRKMNGKL